jgi:S1-C subfamily serine protease
VIRPLLLLVLIGIAGFSGFIACEDGGGNDAADNDAAASSRTAEVPPFDGSQDTTGGTVHLVKELTPSVVHIASEIATQDFFGRLVPQRGVGTGFIIDDQGHIVTNNHVITLDGENPAQSITVTLTDGRQLEAEIVGRDARTDLAVLKVDAGNLTPVRLGNSGDLEVGEDVIAIGNALDLPGGPTVTRGVVSALFRTIEEGNTSIPDAIQTDAAINVGNSGGPLVNGNGEVVGITTAVIRGNAEGIGLAISIDLAKPIVNELIANGEVDRGFLGVTIAGLSSPEARSCGVEAEEGVLLAGVANDSPAEDGGLQECDVIVRLGDEEISAAGDLFQALTTNKAGETVSVEYIRDGDSQTTEVTLE